MRACKVLETMKDKFSALKIEIWNESHIVWEQRISHRLGAIPNPHFHNINSHTLVHFKKHTKILRENTKIH